jgi:hypothetical protein
MGEGISLARLLIGWGMEKSPSVAIIVKAQRLMLEATLAVIFMTALQYIFLKRLKSRRFNFFILLFLLLAFICFNSIFRDCLILPVHILILIWLFWLLFKAFLNTKNKKIALGEVLLAASILIISAAVIELLLFSLKIVPPYPKYLVRGSRWHDARFNNTGFLDKERVFANPNNIRVLFIGDSFLEIYEIPLVSACERLVESHTDKRIEFINLGITDSDPVDYYWRIKRIGIRFRPQIVAIFIFEGNDFITSDRLKLGLGSNRFFALYPQPSIFANVFPRLTSLLTTLYYYLYNLGGVPWIETSAFRGLSQKDKEAKFTELLSKKGRISYLEARGYVEKLSPRTKDFIFRQGNFPGYYFNRIVDANFHNRKTVTVCKSEYTIECLLAVKNLFSERGYAGEIMVFFIPVAEKVDPRFLSVFQDLAQTKDLPFGPLLGQGEYESFRSSLEREGIRVFNLADVLRGVSGAYSSDGHWSPRGARLVEQYVSSRIWDILSGNK